MSKIEIKEIDYLEKNGFQPLEIIAILNTPLDGRKAIIQHQQSNLGKRIAHACFAAGKINPDCAIINSGAIRLDNLLQGSISQLDIIRCLPFGGTVIEVEMTGKLLKKVLDTGWNNKETSGYLQWYSVYYLADQEQWKIRDEEIKDQQNYVVAMNDFLLTGLEKAMQFFTKETEGILNIHHPNPKDITDKRRDIRLAVIDLMKKMR